MSPTFVFKPRQEKPAPVFHPYQGIRKGGLRLGAAVWRERVCYGQLTVKVIVSYLYLAEYFQHEWSELQLETVSKLWLEVLTSMK